MEGMTHPAEPPVGIWKFGDGEQSFEKISEKYPGTRKVSKSEDGGQLDTYS